MKNQPMLRNALMLKVCGIRDLGNAMQVADIKPNMMGFILFEKSPRFITLQNAEMISRQLPKTIQKTAVMVNPTLAEAREVADSNAFDFIQLHGNESVEFCQELSKYINLIKAFSIDNQIPNDIEQYSNYCKYFLFDTKCKTFGGSGEKFDHRLLQNSTIRTPFLISGGIDTSDIQRIENMFIANLTGIDVNSKFETSPGIKDIKKLEKLSKAINHV